MLSGGKLREFLHYDPATGIFRWNIKSAQRIKIGDVAGSKNGKGYLTIQLFGRLYLAHRLAFLYMTDKWPLKDVDHVNRVRDDNRFINLRLATESQNGSNTGKYSNNKSGAKGVSWNPSANKWEASIRFNGRRHYLGIFDSVDEASDIYYFAATLIHGEFARK